MVRDFFFEIGCEELPPGYIEIALEQLEALLRKSFRDALIDYKGELETYGTLRRLIIFVPNVAESQNDSTSEVTGPPVKAAFDQNGNPTKAGLGFAKKVGVSIEALGRKQTDRGEYLVCHEHRHGRPTIELLSQFIPVWTNSINFPKSMRWTETAFRFARPVRRIVALFGADVVPVSLDGVIAGRLTQGHPRLAAGPVEVHSFADFKEKLARNYVIMDIAERERVITARLAEESDRTNAVLIKDRELVRTVARCSEFPEIVSGTFDEAFLDLPRPVLITSMRTHQKFFALEDKQGNLLPRFLHVIDNPVAQHEAVRRGNEKVLTARLNDAQFFFREDRKLSLNDRFEKIHSIIFQQKLGSMKDKARRLEILVHKTGQHLFPDLTESEGQRMIQAAHLCKVDLQTLMVGEFPDLQGTMGQEYAVLQGEDRETARAIFEHYLPRGPEDMVPTSRTGIALAIADKMDTLCGYFKIGLVPTGSEDPFALRRQAAGVCQIALQNKLTLQLDQITRMALEQYQTVTGKEESVLQDMRAFFSRRLSTIMNAEGYHYDTIEACLEHGWTDPLDLGQRLEALHEFRNRADFEDLMIGYRRAARIIPADFDGTFSEESLEEDGEIKLYETYRQRAPLIEQYLQAADYRKMLAGLAEFKLPIDEFFIKIMVMCERTSLRVNRLALLALIVRMFRSFADFSRIVISQDRDITP